MNADAWAVADPTLCDVCGRDACEDHLPPPEPVPAPPRLVFQPAAVVMHTPPPVTVVEGVAWEGQITIVVAESGVGKTFVALSQAAAVSAGLPWHGRRTEAGSVAYLSFEGDALGLRLRALAEAQGHRLDHLHLVRASDPLSPRVGRDGSEEPSRGELDVLAALDALGVDLAAQARPPLRLLVIDTVRASLAGSEDQSDNAAAYLRVVRRLLARVPGAAAILTHHAGWQDGEQKRKRERGSSAWRGNVDATIYLEAGEREPARNERAITLHALKVRDDAELPPLHLVRRVVELDGCDRYGRPLTSCVIEADRRTRQDREAERVAATTAEAEAFDLRLLRTIAERPDMATSQDRLRLMLGVRKELVGEGLGRLARREWAVPGKRREPYHVTDTGRAALEGQPC